MPEARPSPTAPGTSAPGAPASGAPVPDALADAGADGAARHGRAVSSMFGRIAPCYDVLNLVLSCGIDRLWRRRLADSVRVGATGRVLDLAAGTLDVALALRRRHPGVVVPAMDFCPPMLVRGLAKLHGGDAAHIHPVAADAKRLPLPDACVDSVTMAFGIRNILPRSEAFAEMLRVLAPGGRACILEFGSGQRRIWGGLYNWYITRVLPRFGRWVSGDTGGEGQGEGAYTYLAETICRFPTAEALAEEMRQAGFARVWHHDLTSGITCLHIGEKAL